MARVSPDQLDPRNRLELYSKDAIRNADFWTDKLIREEYSRLRDIARKRLTRIKAAGEMDSWAWRKYSDAFPTARGQSTAEIADKLPALARFIAAKTSTISGIRAQQTKAVETLQAHGYTGITKSNLSAFGQFMEEWRAKKLDRSYGSPTAVEMFEWSQEQNIPWDRIKGNFARWLQHYEKLSAWVEKQEEAGRGVDADDIIARFDKLEEQRQKKNAQARAKRQSAKKQSKRK